MCTKRIIIIITTITMHELARVLAAGSTCTLLEPVSGSGCGREGDWQPVPAQFSTRVSNYLPENDVMVALEYMHSNTSQPNIQGS